MAENLIRKIESCVDIFYGNVEIESIPECESGNKNAISNFNNIYNGNHTPKIKAFTLEGDKNENQLGAGRALINPEITGWWSKSLSSGTADGENVPDGENGGYKFSDDLILTVNFDEPRPIKSLDIFGDKMLNEYPTQVQVTLYNAENKSIFSKKFNNNVGVDFTVLLTSEEQNESDNGYITGVKSFKVKILEWNKPHRVSKIYRCYDDILERYTQDELKNFECIREIPNSSEIKYGLISGSCSVTLLNNKDRKFDRGYLKDVAHINKRVVPHINGKRLGTYFIKEWDISQQDMFVKCKANDRLIDFRDIIFKGRMPGENEGKVTLGALFKEVLDFVKEHYVKKFEYEIDENLTNSNKSVVLVEPYLPRDSVWSVLQSLCNASLSYIYVDRDDKICVHSDLFAHNENKQSTAKINPDNAFSISVPFFADMEATRAEVPYFRKVVKEDEELCRINNVNLNAGQTLEEIVEFDDYCIAEDIDIGEFDYNLNISKENDSDFKYKISFEPLRKIEDKTLIVIGKKITFEKQIFNNADTENGNSSLSLYSHQKSELIQNKQLAEKIAQRILEIYPAGTRTCTANWRGDEELNLFEKCEVKDRFGVRADYITTYLKCSVDGGFRQEVKGVLTGKIKADT